jgi:hypothetical protein
MLPAVLVHVLLRVAISFGLAVPTDNGEPDPG